MRQSLELKRNKIKDAFDLIKFPLRELIALEKRTAADGNLTETKLTEFVRSHFEYVINYSVFEKLMKNVNAQYDDKQIQILFDILDSDKNRLLSTAWAFFQ